MVGTSNLGSWNGHWPIRPIHDSTKTSVWTPETRCLGPWPIGLGSAPAYSGTIIWWGSHRLAFSLLPLLILSRYGSLYIIMRCDGTSRGAWSLVNLEHTHTHTVYIYINILIYININIYIYIHTYEHVININMQLCGLAVIWPFLCSF